MDTILPPVTMAEFEELASRSETVINRLRDRVFSEGRAKKLELRFNVRTAAEMVGRSEKLIRDAEGDGRLPEPEKDPKTNRRLGYSLAEVNRMREVFGTLPTAPKATRRWFCRSSRSRAAWANPRSPVTWRSISRSRAIGSA